MACSCSQEMMDPDLELEFDDEATLGDVDLEYGDPMGDEFELEADLDSEFEARRIGDLDLEEPGDLNDSELEIIGRDTRVYTPQTTRAPFRYICNLEYDVPSIGRRPMCSGTLIGPRTVLTAGHCLTTPSKMLTPSKMRVIPGRKGSSEPLPATEATRFILPKGYAPSSPTDYGIIHLRDKIGSAIGFWARTHTVRKHDPLGTSMTTGTLPLPAGRIRVNLSGYPADRPSAARYGCWNRSRPKRRCYHTALSDPKRHRLCGAYQYRAYNRTVQLRGGMLHYLNDTCPGHSGSPVWVRRHRSKGGRVLVAVHVAGDDGSGTVANRSVFLHANLRRFIAANLR